MKRNGIKEQVEHYLDPDDGRYEDLTNQPVFRSVGKDLLAGSIVAATIIPFAMGIAMASGMRPEQGIIGGAVAGILGALFCGSKYQVYGPAAALIPVIAGLMAVYDQGVMIMASVIAGILLLLSGFLKIGRIIEKIPQPVITGFTAGIALIIAFSQVSDIAGLKEKEGYLFIDQLRFVADNIAAVNIAAIIMTVCTFILCQAFLRISLFIPGLLIAMAFGFLGALTFWADKGLVLIGDRYESMSGGFFAVISPALPAEWNTRVVLDLLYYSFAIYIVVAIESLSGGNRADRLADNTGRSFHPQKELWGLGIMNIFTPIINSFPHTGTWTGTSLNIRTGALSPLAGIARSASILVLAAFFSIYFEKVPIACMSGILLSVAFNMIKLREIKKVMDMGYFHFALMTYTAVMVLLSGVIQALLSAILLYIIFYRRFNKKQTKNITRHEKMMV